MNIFKCSVELNAAFFKPNLQERKRKKSQPSSQWILFYTQFTTRWNLGWILTIDKFTSPLIHPLIERQNSIDCVSSIKLARTLSRYNKRTVFIFTLKHLTCINIRSPACERLTWIPFIVGLYNETPPQFTFWKDFEGRFSKNVVLWHFLRSDFFFSPRTSPPAAKTCQAGASQSKGVRGHQLESHPRPREPAAQLATGSGMSDFLHGVTAVCGEVTATSQYAAPFSVWRGRPHLNSKEPSQCHQ